MTRAHIRPTISVPRTQVRHPLRRRDWPRPPKHDPHSRVIAQLLALAGTDSSVIATSARPWASATFLGARHRIVLKIEGDDHVEKAETFAKNLPDAEFSITGHIVADACVDEWKMMAERPDACTSGNEPTGRGSVILTVFVLTVEDW